MSIERANGQVSIACDACGECSEAEDEFSDAMAEFRADGGRSFNIRGEWVNLCAECAAARAEELRR